MAAHGDSTSVFKRPIGTAQHTTEHPHGSEDDYFHLLQRTMAVSPWIEDRDENLPSVADRNIAAVAEFAHKLAETANFQEFAQIETAFIQRILSTKDFARMATEHTGDPVKTVSIVPDGATHAPFLPTRPRL
jgi:hypothetical protein